MTITQTWTEDGSARLIEMRNHVTAIGGHWGFGSQEYLEAVRSLCLCLVSMAGMPDVRAGSDYLPLSLLCTSRSLTFGVIFHRRRRGCQHETCEVELLDDGRVVKTWSDAPDCGNHVPTYPLGFPAPGEWSMHS